MENHLKKIRKDRGLTLDELSAKVGLAHSTLSQYENGRRDPKKFDTWKRIASALGVTLSDLLDLNEVPLDDYVKHSSDELWGHDVEAYVLAMNLGPDQYVIGKQALTPMEAHLFERTVEEIKRLRQGGLSG